MTLLDGYCTYLAAKELGIEKLPVMYKSDEAADNKYLYVYGVHPNSYDEKEYVWKIKRKSRTVKELMPGNYALAETKFGLSPIIIAKVTEQKLENIDDKDIKSIIRKIDRVYPRQKEKVTEC